MKNNHYLRILIIIWVHGHTAGQLIEQVNRQVMPRSAQKNLRRGCCKGRHPRLKHAPPETERVLPHNNQVDHLQHRELVQKNTKDYCDNEHGQL